MNDPLNDAPEPANLRFLRRLVTVLTAVMIGGLLLIVALLVIRFSTQRQVVPDTISLPGGITAEAFTMTPDWYAVVTDKGRRILIFSRADGQMIQTIDVAN
ncbi:DUF6476 family protein [Arenibacterium halophilum]|uniref:DUF6476 family protein n=1 Tax=Arenibacterium halophilum TaxID=2583821 RepID=UPI001486BC9C|nr:DUF6476 family protein [Arenibacterium halophilum]